ncbi:unnamed protein product [Pedinophyceae sp. YPF-701]|nr:unnamed protein product [Pedinophyceae sp. YPF-701]
MSRDDRQLANDIMPERSVGGDVVSQLDSFQALDIPAPLQRGLAACGFHRPSPVQAAAIPVGRTGADLVVQARGGTGKTLAFSLLALLAVDPTVGNPQAVILAHTREVALQICSVVRGLAKYAPEICCAALIGGRPIQADFETLLQPCHIIVATLGRLSAVEAAGKLPKLRVRMLVLDEADHLLSDSFLQSTVKIHDFLPERKQVLAFSATWPPSLLALTEGLMDRPKRVMLSAGDLDPPLAVRQFYRRVADTGEAPSDVNAAKRAELLSLLSSAAFHQAVVFCNNAAAGSALAAALVDNGFPAAFLSGKQEQSSRDAGVTGMRAFRLRVVVSTDLVARGVDLDRVNIVVNVDVPRDAATYVHRVARAGRFGTGGAAVSLVTPGELRRLRGLASEGGFDVEELTGVVPGDLLERGLRDDGDAGRLEELRALQRYVVTSGDGGGTERVLRGRVDGGVDDGAGAEGEEEDERTREMRWRWWKWRHEWFLWLKECHRLAVEARSSGEAAPSGVAQ